MSEQENLERKPQIREQSLTALAALARHFGVEDKGKGFEMEDGVVYCIVCGNGSHREDWKVKGKVPACDFHPKSEVEAAIKAKAPAPAGK